MTFRDGELTHTNQTVHLTGVLVAEEGRGFAQTHRQVAVRAGAVEVDLILERAGHRAQRKALFGFVVWVAQYKHAIQVVIPVTADFVQLSLCHVRGFGQLVATLCLGVLNPALKLLDDLGAVWQDNRQTLTDHIDSGEIFQLTTDLVVVAAAGFLLLLQEGIQLACFRE